MPKKPTRRSDAELLKESEEIDALTIEEIAKMWNEATPVDIKFVDKRPKRKAAAKTVKKRARSVKSSR